LFLTDYQVDKTNINKKTLGIFKPGRNKIPGSIAGTIAEREIAD
jgi:hypothetical protein